MLGLMQANTPTYPPRWWQLLQRIALRWIWVSHAQRLYGDDMIYGDPSSMLTHIQLELDSRIHWHWAKLRRHHDRAHHKANQPRPHTAFKQVWGPMVVFDTKGKILSLALPTKKQE